MSSGNILFSSVVLIDQSLYGRPSFNGLISEPFHILVFTNKSVKKVDLAVCLNPMIPLPLRCPIRSLYLNSCLLSPWVTVETT